MAKAMRKMTEVEIVKTVEVPRYSITDLTPAEFQALRNALFNYSNGRSISGVMGLPSEWNDDRTQSQIARDLLDTLPLAQA